MTAQIYPLVALGLWDEALAAAEEVSAANLMEDRSTFLFLLCDLPLIRIARGDEDEAQRCVEVFAGAGISADVQERAIYAAGHAALLHSEGRHAEALAAVQTALESGEELGRGSQPFREGFLVAVEAASRL